MEKIVMGFLFLLLIGCSNIYIPNPGTRTEEITNTGKSIVKYDNLTTLENDKIVCKNGCEINGKFTGTITHKEKIAPKDLSVLRSRTIEQNFKSGDLISVKVENFETLDKNGNFVIYNGIFDKNKKFTGEMETVLFYDIAFIDAITPSNLVNFSKEKFYKETGVNLLYEYTLRGIVEKVYLNNNNKFKKELIFKLYSEEIKDYNFDFVFYSEEIKNGIKTVYASNMYKNLEETLTKYFSLIENNKFSYKTYSNNKKFIDKREKKVLKVGKALEVKDIEALLPISVLVYNEAGTKKIQQEIILKYNIKSNKLLETKYTVNNKVIDTSKMSRKEREEILKNIVTSEEKNIRRKFTDIHEERVRIIERQRKIQNIMAILSVVTNQIQQQQQAVEQQKQLENALKNSQDALFRNQMNFQNLKLDLTPFPTNADREAARVNMWDQSLKQYYGF